MALGWTTRAFFGQPLRRRPDESPVWSTWSAAGCWDLVADRTRAAVDGWLQARPRDWLAQVGTVALDPWRGYASALVALLGHVTVVVDHVHAIRLANAVADQAHRRMQQVTLGHRGRTYDSLYRIRKLLVTAAEQLTERGQARLRARDTMKIERGAVRSANLDSTQVAFVVGSSVTVPNRVSMRTRSSPATSVFPHPTGSSAGYHRRDWCRARRPLGATPDMKGWSVVTAGVLGRARVAD